MLKVLVISVIITKFPSDSQPIHDSGDDTTEDATFTFDCSRRAIGFYADVEYNCQIFHMCDPEGRRIPHSCANDTSFNQEYRVCDWDSNFECADAPKWYYLNELTYATDTPIEDVDYS